MNNLILPEERNSYYVNKENEKVLFPYCDGSGIETVAKKRC